MTPSFFFTEGRNSLRATSSAVSLTGGKEPGLGIDGLLYSCGSGGDQLPLILKRPSSTPRSFNSPMIESASSLNSFTDASCILLSSEDDHFKGISGVRGIPAGDASDRRFADDSTAFKSLALGFVRVLSAASHVGLVHFFRTLEHQVFVIEALPQPVNHEPRRLVADP